MKLCKAQVNEGQPRIGMLEDGRVHFLTVDLSAGISSISDILHRDDPATVAHDLVDRRVSPVAVADVTLLPPIDRQEVWAAGVTYKRSEEARERESAGAARFYDRVYSAPRPELFFKASADRVIGTGGTVHIRRDSRWTVPEPELALILSPRLRIVGYTIGNDMSARDIEGENPLYLPQAKIYDRSCALGPVITLAEAMPPLEQVTIRMRIDRHGSAVFDGSTSMVAMKRSCQELADWLGRETGFPHGAVLLTGTGVVPPDDFALAAGDLVTIDVTGIGQLLNRVGMREPQFDQ
jgi:2-dehydro-3-deoxy-D-arabinonate dehydratase